MTPEKYAVDLASFKAQVADNADNRFPEIKEIPALTDESLVPHHEWSYVLHTAWAARVLSETKPKLHVDVSSYIYFATILSAFIPIKYMEFRSVHIPLSNIETESIDLETVLPTRYHNSCDSLSCMHSLEHIGLGRYGDIINPRGDHAAADNLYRMLKAGGDLLIVVPVGKPRLEFNSSRTYSYDQVIGMFFALKLVEFSLIPDTYRETSALIRHAPPSMVQDQIDGTGCFWFKKH